jgi:DNA polymerase-3 subunit alpha
LPAFPVPAGHTIESFIRTEAQAGLEAHLAKRAPAQGFALDDYARRLGAELDVIVKMGFAATS